MAHENEDDLLARITSLVDQEHDLERSHVGVVANDDDIARLRSIEVALDQCWDLLRQRRARREAGLDPDDASIRPAEIVEGYQQ